MKMAVMALAGTVLAATPAWPAVSGPLEPYQMVRSLQLVQDRLARGDHAAMPMQRKLLEIIDNRLRGADLTEFDDERNFRALFIYAMSGGNPSTVRLLLAKLDLEGEDGALAKGVLNYMAGSLGAAREALAHTDPMKLAPELGAFVALVRGAVLVQENPTGALRLFDDARLLAPGTLVEEAALRRSVTVAAEIGDTKRFARAAGQYVRRFLHSPYASQFAEGFVSGIVELEGKIDLERVARIVSGMDAERAHVIYLRLARQAAINGYGKLLAFASANAEQTAGPGAAEEDPRALLYSTIASVTSENVDEVRKQLNAIDRARLSASDRKLLDAAQAVAHEVVAAPAQGTLQPGEQAKEPPEPVEAAALAGETTPDAPKAAEVKPVADGSVAGTTAFVTATREHLEAIDRLLKETTDE